jgi:hypothetical protein
VNVFYGDGFNPGWQKNAESAFTKPSCFYCYAVIGHNLGFQIATSGPEGFGICGIAALYQFNRHNSAFFYTQYSTIPSFLVASQRGWPKKNIYFKQVVKFPIN